MEPGFVTFCLVVGGTAAYAAFKLIRGHLEHRRILRGIDEWKEIEKVFRSSTNQEELLQARARMLLKVDLPLGERTDNPRYAEQLEASLKVARKFYKNDTRLQPVEETLSFWQHIMKS